MRYFHKRVWLGFLTAIGIIAWLAFTSYSNNKKTERTSKMVAHTNRVLFHSEQILALIVDLESSQRGFSLTGHDKFIEQVDQSIVRLKDHVESLKDVTVDNSAHIERIKKLEVHINNKVDFMRNAINVRKTEGLEKVIELNASLQGKKLMDLIRDQINELQQEEHELLKERTALTQKKIDDFNAAFAGMLLVTMIILVVVFYMIYISLKKQMEAEQSLRRASDRIQDMYDNAPCGYHSLNAAGLFVEVNNTWLDWLKYTREEVVNKMYFHEILTEESRPAFHQRFNAFLHEGKITNHLFEVVRRDGTTFPVLLNAVAIYDENKVFQKSRSTVLDYTQQKKSLDQIEQLNQELESFSYSVSHDLRAPLRSIDGYTQILLEDYAENLDSEGKRVLNVVVNNARRMAKLIDDLLDFSRIGRKEVTKSVVNTEGIVRSVMSELVSLEDGRIMDIRVCPLDPCEADPNLLRQVWVNLISNAIKYTRKKSKTEIEISSRKTPAEVVYSISDNGTGFDMQYSHKLFGVFQRLHRQQDFEGTGVGLAIVHRIISRHGGRVWAEAEVNKGASFHFALPNSLI